MRRLRWPAGPKSPLFVLFLVLSLTLLFGVSSFTLTPMSQLRVRSTSSSSSSSSSSSTTTASLSTRSTHRRPSVHLLSSHATAAQSSTQSPIIHTLLVNNYDSYTFNLYQLLSSTMKNPLSTITVVNNDDFPDYSSCCRHFFPPPSPSSSSSPLTASFSNVVISPGPGSVSNGWPDFGFCPSIYSEAGPSVPVLGVCLGHQGLAHHYAPSAHKDLVIQKAVVPMHGRFSKVFFSPPLDSHLHLFSGLPQGFDVVRYHSLAVAPSYLPPSLRVTARCDDSALLPSAASKAPLETIMALQHSTLPQFGVQFHPESIGSLPFGKTIVENFRDITAKHVEARVASSGVGPSPTLRPPTELVSPARVGSVPSSPPSPPSTPPPRFKVLVSKLPAPPSGTLRDTALLFSSLYSNHSASFWLDSASAASDFSRFSFMGSVESGGPLSHAVEYYGSDDVVVIKNDRAEKWSGKGGILAFLQAGLEGGMEGVEVVQGEGDDKPTPDIPFDFLGGYVGFLGYEVRHDCADSAPVPKSAGVHNSSAATVPVSAFLFADRFIAVDHKTGELYVVAVVEGSSRGREVEEASRRAGLDWIAATKRKVEQTTRERAEAEEASPTAATHPPGLGIAFAPNRSRAVYERDIRACKEEILNGETYEVCLTNKLVSKSRVDPYLVYKELRKSNKAPFSAFVKFDRAGRLLSSTPRSSVAPPPLIFPTASVALCCSSPERFLRITPSREIESKPIKGTIRRGSTPSEDEANAVTLATSEKDRAENLMIVDLVRNDFGRVSSVGTVAVPKLMSVESYATVHQLVSTIRGSIRPDCTAFDAVRSCFPGGSMTGAPKRRTMDIIHDVEGGVPRGPYSGSIGYFGVNGAADLNIVIRTAIVTPDEVSVGAGGAITHLSEVSGEYEEMLLKARVVVDAVTRSQTVSTAEFSAVKAVVS